MKIQVHSIAHHLMILIKALGCNEFVALTQNRLNTAKIVLCR